MAKGLCPKCGEPKEKPKSPYCRKCGNDWQNKYKKTHPQVMTDEQKARQLETERLRIAAMDADKKIGYLARKNSARIKWIASDPSIRIEMNRKAREVRKTWTPERIAQQKVTQRAHYEKLSLRTLRGLCAHSVNCNERPIGQQKFCLWHWCDGLRQADPRLKSQYTTDELVAQWNLQHGCCAITGILLIAGETAALDHIVPVARGGTGIISNLRFIHRYVNRFKWTMLDDEFKAIIPMLCPKLIEWAAK